MERLKINAKETLQLLMSINSNWDGKIMSPCYWFSNVWLTNPGFYKVDVCCMIKYIVVILVDKDYYMLC